MDFPQHNLLRRSKKTQEELEFQPTETASATEDHMPRIIIKFSNQSLKKMPQNVSRDHENRHLLNFFSKSAMGTSKTGLFVNKEESASHRGVSTCNTHVGDQMFRLARKNWSIPVLVGGFDKLNTNAILHIAYCVITSAYHRKSITTPKKEKWDFGLIQWSKCLNLSKRLFLFAAYANSNLAFWQVP